MIYCTKMHLSLSIIKSKFRFETFSIRFRTYFADPREIVMLDYGEFIVHPGKRVHCGVDITRGSRYLMVMFANLADKRFALL